MRIGILTLPLHVNYGGILQAYALQTVLERMGHDVCIIEEKFNKHPYYLMPLIYLKRLYRKIIKKENVDVFYEYNIRKIRQITCRDIKPFLKRYIHSFTTRDLQCLREVDFDAIVVGSDQIWRPLYYPEISHAFLDFTKRWNMIRISYAASFGTDDWEYTIEQTQTCASLLKSFDVVSVREDSGVENCSRFLGVDAHQVLDPTMLLEAEDYIALFKNASITKSPGRLLCYVLDDTEEKSMLINQIAQQCSLKPFAVNSKAEHAERMKKRQVQPSVEQFLRGFYDAKVIVTDSFHACVFSILFNKPFVVYGNKERGMTRFHSLLKLFGLEKQLICSLDEYYDAIFDIDWDRVNIILGEQKKYSKNILSQTLSTTHV